jgi:hypothetical protein
VFFFLRIHNIMSGAAAQGAILSSLPLHQLFGNPFKAAVKAQAAMTASTANFLKTFALNPDGELWMTSVTTYYDIPISALGSDVSGGQFWPSKTLTPSQLVDTPSYTTGVVPFRDAPPKSGIMYRRGCLVSTDPSGFILSCQGIRTINVPFIALLNVPSLAMTLVTVDFAITIDTQQATAQSDSNSYGVKASASYSGSFWGASFGAHIDVNATSTNSTDSSASTSTSSTYQVHMRAQQVQSVGLKMISDYIIGMKTGVAALQKQGKGDGGRWEAQDANPNAIGVFSGST